jgi:hypothetical protein
VPPYLMTRYWGMNFGGSRVILLADAPDLHDVVHMAFKDLHTFPALVPVPELDEHVIGTGQQIRQRRVHRYRADVVGVCFKHFLTFHCVVVVDADDHVVASCGHPLLARDELGATGRHICRLEGLDHCLHVCMRGRASKVTQA